MTKLGLAKYFKHQEDLSYVKAEAERSSNDGVTYDKKGRLSEAIAKYKRTLALNPLHAEARNNLGVAYDKKKYRLGRGKGFYDRFLNDLSKETPTIGLAFDFQVIDDIPHEEHDVPVDYVITN